MVAYPSKKRLESAEHPKVRQDLGTLIKAVEDGLRTSKLTRKHMLPYCNLSRLRRYAGLEDGYTPVAGLARERRELEGQ